MCFAADTKEQTPQTIPLDYSNMKCNQQGYAKFPKQWQPPNPCLSLQPPVYIPIQETKKEKEKISWPN